MSKSIAYGLSLSLMLRGTVKAQAAALSERPDSGRSSNKAAALQKLRERRRRSLNGGWSPRDAEKGQHASSGQR